MSFLAKIEAHYAETESVPEVIPSGTKVYLKDKKTTGRTTGNTKPCIIVGCTHDRVEIKWSNGKVTRLCARSLKPHKDGLIVNQAS